MKSAQLTAIGPAENVVKCVDVPDPGAPGEGEVLVDIAACSINPADILLIEGKYATVPETPCALGIEGAGTVNAVGNGVSALKVGDKVMSLARTNWVQQVRDKAEAFIRLPTDIDLAQAAMLKVNVATAHLMLTTYVSLSAGDWLLQNAANSGVGVDLIRLAHANGVRTVNIVRRRALIEPLKQLGADVVVVDGPDLAKRIAQETGGAVIKLGIDAVGGSATGRLTDCVGDGGTVVNYGLLSGKTCEINAFNFVFRDITLTGFWLARLLRSMSFEQIQGIYDQLARRLTDGTIHVDVEASYPLEQVSDAMAHAKRESRNGKVQLRPNS
ncbi:MAG: zinc-dependent alcohol dehydrogenase family protein [Betaproteobacteria bacterium]|jgi:NADPH:quinone reductase-like Zn-dependent oxidoreductase|nr:MAG: zinc-dependent alcohol dehydrogenase family protein [Betaproteobacteria bacterium]